MFKFTSLLLIVFGITLQINAQCGVYFKETNRQLLSDSFVNSIFEDFDNDGMNDLFGYSLTQISGPRTHQIKYYKRLADNSFDTTAKSTTLTNVGGILGVVGDVNADGKKDLIIRHETSPPTLTTYLNDGTGKFLTATPSINIGIQEVIFAASDLNNDSKADVISITSGGDSTISYRLAQPDNSFGEPVMIATVAGFPVTGNNMNGIIVPSFPLLVVDLNNDGFKDIAIQTYDNRTVSFGNFLHILKNNGDLTFTETTTTSFPRVHTRLRAYDFNNDGKKDFISHPSSDDVKLVLSNEDDTYTASTISFQNNRFDNPIGGTHLTINVSVSDFDNDGDLDVIYPGSKRYLLFKNQGNGTFVQEQFKSLQKIDDIVNLDKDGRGDAVSLISPMLSGAYVLNDGTNNHYNYLQKALSFKKNVCNPVGQTKIVDFDGDGSTDIAFWNPANGSWRYYSQQNAQAPFEWGLGSFNDVPVPNDYDGDGQTDYAIYRKSTGTWWIYRSSDQQSFAIKFGTTEDKPVPADYDGDGSADFAVFRPSTGDWHFWLSQTNQYTVVHFGISEDKPVPADYDGDGKADITIFRPSTGVWYRYNSSDQSIFIVEYGISTDKPISADYDADGKANIAVYRDGVTYVLKDDFSSGFINWGTANDQPFFNDAGLPWFAVYRKNENKVYTATSQTLLTGFVFPFEVGNSANEIFVSSILPPE